MRMDRISLRIRSVVIDLERFINPKHLFLFIPTVGILLFDKFWAPGFIDHIVAALLQTGHGPDTLKHIILRIDKINHSVMPELELERLGRRITINLSALPSVVT